METTVKKKFSVDDALFAHAVNLAAAFVANGDIRCGGSTKGDAQAFDQVKDLIVTLYDALEDARYAIAHVPPGS